MYFCDWIWHFHYFVVDWGWNLGLNQGLLNRLVHPYCQCPSLGQMKSQHPSFWAYRQAIVPQSQLYWTYLPSHRGLWVAKQSNRCVSHSWSSEAIPRNSLADFSNPLSYSFCSQHLPASRGCSSPQAMMFASTTSKQLPHPCCSFHQQPESPSSPPRCLALSSFLLLLSLPFSRHHAQTLHRMRFCHVSLAVVLMSCLGQLVQQLHLWENLPSHLRSP